jgi:uncharacterized cofD-like protein
VIFGGGHGQAAIAEGMMLVPGCAITAICGNYDSGGATKIVVEEFNGPACTGDAMRVFQCFIKNKHLRNAWKYRCEKNTTWSGAPAAHILFLAFLKENNYLVNDTLTSMGKALGIEPHRVLAVSERSVDLGTLCIQVGKQGSSLNPVRFRNESSLDKVSETHSGTLAALRVKEVGFDRNAIIAPEVQQAIKEADHLIFAPGSLPATFGTLIPQGVQDALMRVMDTPITLFLNLLREDGVAYDWGAEEIVGAYQGLAGRPVSHVVCGDFSTSEQRQNGLLKQAGRKAVDWRKFASQDRVGPRIPSRLIGAPLLCRNSDGSFGHDPKIVAEVFQKIMRMDTLRNERKKGA